MVGYVIADEQLLSMCRYAGGLMGWIHYTKARCFPVRFLAVFLALLFSFPVPTFAGETPETATIETLLEMSLEELIEVEISIATRSLLAIRKAPAPVRSVFLKPALRFSDLIHSMNSLSLC